MTAQQFNTWIRPLQAVEKQGEMTLLAPNEFVRDWVNEHLRVHLDDVFRRVSGKDGTISIQIGSLASNDEDQSVANPPQIKPVNEIRRNASIGLRNMFTFDNFVEGK